MTGAVVANIYYNQPLLNLMATSVHQPRAQLGLVATLTQLGYAVGLGVFVPLGDFVDRRQLMSRLLALAALALGAAAWAPQLIWLVVASFGIGLFSVVPQIIIPLAADLAAPGTRGRVVGALMSGLLAGILLARTVSGVVAAQAGWRAVFGLAALFMALLWLAVRVALPPLPPRHDPKPYRAVLISVLRLVGQYPELRRIGLTGAGFFAAFSCFWTTLTFRLAQAPYHFGSSIIGLFGLAGMGGTLVAPIAGRWADRRDPRHTVTASLILVAGIFAALIFFNQWLGMMIAAAVLLDVGTNGAQISNQSRMYALDATAQSRMNTVYMVCYFLGGAMGSGVGSAAWHWGGYAVVNLCALGFLALSAAFHWSSFRHYRPVSYREL
jgi:predicted MFS family arabinose efflux permease